MSIEFYFDSGKKIFRGKIENSFSLEEFERAIREMAAADDVTLRCPRLWDLCNLDFSAFDTAAVRQIVEVRKNYPEQEETRIALVVSDDLGFGMARMYELLLSGLPQHIMVFRTEEDAEKWLLND